MQIRGSFVKTNGACPVQASNAAPENSKSPIRYQVRDFTCFTRIPEVSKCTARYI